MKKMLLTAILFVASFTSFAQVGIGTKTPGGALEVLSTNSGLVLPRVASTDVVLNPNTGKKEDLLNGTMVYDISAKCIKAYTNGAWSGCLNIVTTSQPSTNGTGVVSAYACTTDSAGTMTAGTAVSGVTQTITATVTTVGTYNISTTANGVTFAGSGTFAGTGPQQIVLTATGTPTAAAAATAFTLNTTPDCSFNRAIDEAIKSISLTTNGTGVVSAYACSTESVGTMTVGAAVSGVTQTITATVTTVGTYNISTTANGVTFAGSGTFAGTGPQQIVLTATGTPTAAAATTAFTLNTTNGCSFNREVKKPEPKVTALYCSRATHEGTITSGEYTSSSNTYSMVPYAGGNGAEHSSQTVSSTGVTGLTAKLLAGTLNTGSGTLKYSISGTPNSAGTAYFSIEIGGKTCSLTRPVSTKEPKVTNIYCASTVHTGTLIATQYTPDDGYTYSKVPYGGGNGARYTSQNVSSTGVTGLTAKLSTGTLKSGSGELVYIISGTPSSAGTAYFRVSLGVGGTSCSFAREVKKPEPIVSAIYCSSATHEGTITSGEYANGSYVYSIVSYAGGNGAAYPNQTVYSTGVTGLTAKLLGAGNLNTGNGTMLFSISGTPNSAGTAYFPIVIGGRTCSLAREVKPKPIQYLKLHNNGVTVIALPAAQTGNTYTLNGIEYFIADNNNIRSNLWRNNLCTTRVTDMNNLFYNNQNITTNVSSWDVSKVTDMSSMFYAARNFDQPIGYWDVSNVRSMLAMFRYCNHFNQYIGDWNVSNVTVMVNMFEDCILFNQNLRDWPVDNVTQCLGFYGGSVVSWGEPKPNFTNCHPLFIVF